MRNRDVIALIVGLALLGQGPLSAEAARKYYPPGFNPTPEPKPTPSQPVQLPPPPPATIIQYVQSKPKVVIHERERERDPLLVLMDEHRYYDALRLVDNKLKKTPGKLDLQLMRGKILRAQGNYSQSRAYFQNILDKGRIGNKVLSKSDRASVLSELGWTLYQKAMNARQTGDEPDYEAGMQAAGNSFLQATQLSRAIAMPWIGLSKVAMAHGRLTEAGTTLQKAKAVAARTPASKPAAGEQDLKLSVDLAEAEWLLLRNKTDEALQILYGAKKMTTHDQDVFLLLAKASLAAGKVDDAIINLKQLLELTPDHTEALKLLSRSYELKMKPEDAEQVLEKAIALNPSDETSVNALLKIYEQRNESERSILLLKTLLKDRPGNTAYAAMLTRRLAESGDWDGVYQEGQTLLEPVLAVKPVTASTEADQREVVALLAQAAYRKRRSMLDSHNLMKEPAIKMARDYSQERLTRMMTEPKPNYRETLADQLNLLLLDPLTPLPMVPSDFEPGTRENLLLALQISFLRGNQPLHARLLQEARAQDNELEIARMLCDIGDYEGAMVLTSDILSVHPTSTAPVSSINQAEALKLKQNILDARKEIQDHLTLLSLLPRKIPDTYWEKAASAALSAGTGDWKTHAVIGNMLEKRRHPRLALIHQRLAAQYAPAGAQKQYWLRRAARTMHMLTRNYSQKLSDQRQASEAAP